jgi:ribosomal protein L37AE/L43A
MEAVMSSDGNDKDGTEMRVELKYCEYCGGLWVRERGAGVVFCEKCQSKVDDLPMQKKRPGRVRLPSRLRRPDGPEYSVVFEEELPDLDAVGGVA